MEKVILLFSFLIWLVSCFFLDSYSSRLFFVKYLKYLTNVIFVCLPQVSAETSKGWGEYSDPLEVPTGQQQQYKYDDEGM